MTGSTGLRLARLARLARTGGPHAVRRGIARASRRELECRRIEHSLGRAGRRGTHVVVGPFLGEVGFELLYWIPMLRRLLSRHRVAPADVTVLTRGGAAAWYGDIADHSIEILDLFPPDAFAARLADRRLRAGDAKQLTIEAFDRELIAAVLERTGAATIVHPVLMFARLRWVWQGAEAVSLLHSRAEYGSLATRRIPPTIGLPERFIAVKAYFSDCFPRTSAAEGFLQDVVERLTRAADVVVLTTGIALDDHAEWNIDTRTRARVIEPVLDPLSNLAQQTDIVARAAALVSTYGGFSYLGPFLDVPTVAFHSRPPANEIHLAVLRAARPQNTYTLSGLSVEETVNHALKAAR